MHRTAATDASARVGAALRALRALRVLRVLRALRVLLLALGLSPVSMAAESGIAQLSWLAGCWRLESGERRIDEQWMAPRGGMMLGVSRTVVGASATDFEFLQIEEREGLLVLTARPSGQSTTEFASIELGADRVVFENAKHDFPQRVIYALQPGGALLARIEGMRDGRLQGVDFPYRRVDCPAAP